MSGRIEPVTVEILDKEYVVSCPSDEREALVDSARDLDQRLRQVRDSGKVLGTERMAVITALNLVHELNQYRRSQALIAEEVNDDLRRLEGKVDVAVGRRREPGPVD